MKTMIIVGLWMALGCAAPVFAQVGAPQGGALETVPPRQQQWRDATVPQRRLIAEQLGEQGAQEFAKKQGYKPLLKPEQKNLRQGPDLGYRAKDGSTVVMEAKGGRSPLGSGYQTRQGTPDWAIRSAEATLNSPKASPVEKEFAKNTLQAGREGKLRVEVVRTPHVEGVPGRPVLESSRQASAANGRAADAILKKGTGTAGKSAAQGLRGTHGAKVLARGAKGLPLLGAAVEGTTRTLEVLDTERAYREGEITSEQRIGIHAKSAGGVTGGAAGAWLGFKGGAAIGGMIGAGFGGIGAAVGAPIGGALGAIGGYFAGEYAGEKVVEGVLER